MGRLARFVVYRKEDVSGISGTGEIAEGVEFSDGQVVLCWHNSHSVGVYANMGVAKEIHGHEGKTEMRWVDGAGMA